MNLKNRIRKLEAGMMPALPCFCGKTLIDLWYGGIDAGTLTYCRNCKPQFDGWAKMTAEAGRNENLTDKL